MSRVNEQKRKYLQKLNNGSDFLDKNAKKLTFSFKYFRDGEKGGESFETWEDERILADLNNKLKDFSGMDKAELILKSVLEIFSAYPTDSEFDEPEDLKDYDIKWARLRLTGKRRLIGFFFNDVKLANVFYIVFLDEKHRFSPSHKKHT